jgi:hypothetical protein
MATKMHLIQRLTIILGLLAMCVGITGCAVEAIPYPRLATVKKLKNKILSREEQDEAIRSLTAEQEQHRTLAIREIEKNQ